MPASRPPGFHARFGALWREYEYRIADRGAERDPTRRRHTLWYDQRLDLDVDERRAAGLLGLHDWAAYCRHRDYATTIRELQEFRWRREADGVLVATVRADAFCHNLVRNLVGACVAVGEGALAGASRRGHAARGPAQRRVPVVPAHGLTMVEVGYPPDDEVAARVALTQVKRSHASWRTDPPAGGGRRLTVRPSRVTLPLGVCATARFRPKLSPPPDSFSRHLR